MERDIEIGGQHYCDYNQDGILDILAVNPNISTHSGMDLASGEALASIEHTGRYIDADGTSVCEYYIVEDNQLYYQRFPSDNRVSLLDISSYSPSSSLFHADVDGDGKQEILFSGSILGGGRDNFLLDHIGTDQFSITQLNYDIPMSNSVRGTRSVKDINNDGVDEILVSEPNYQEVNNGRHKEFWNVIGYNLNADALTQVMQSDSYTTDRFELLHWYDDNGILAKSYGSSTTHTLEIDQHDNVSHRLFATPHADLAVEGSDLRVYQQQTGTGFASKN